MCMAIEAVQAAVMMPDGGGQLRLLGRLCGELFSLFRCNQNG